MANRAGDKHKLQFKLNNIDIGDYLINFEWVSFINSGYRIVASFIDVHENSLDVSVIRDLLEKGRNANDGMDVEFIIHHNNDMKGKKTSKRKAKIINLQQNVSGSLTHSILEIVAIDPASWYLNRGICGGDAYQGSISDVIQNIVEKYSNIGNITIGKTKDNKKNWWWEMRLDPKTLISSLIEWSASITLTKTPLVVQSEDDEFICEEWAKLKAPEKLKDKKFFITNKKGFIKDIDSETTLQILSNNHLMSVATRLYTGSISATTGLYICKENTELSEENRYVSDKFTSNKLMPNISSDQGYKKPNENEFSTFIEPVPEHNNGDVGLKYQDYAIGRARDWFMKLIYNVLRVKVIINPGDSDFDSIKGCGVAKINLEAISLDSTPYYINGDWLMYGFRHLVTQNYWRTELMLARVDYDATGNKI